MKFLIDAHLPPGLCSVLEAAGHDAVHTRDLPEGNAAKDRDLNEVSMRDLRVVVSKDSDFYYSHLLQSRPWKLVLVRIGNLGLRATLDLFERRLPEIVAALEKSSLVEVTLTKVKDVG